jgi:hypothetical protein
MAIQKVVKVNTTTGGLEQYTPLDTSAGAGSAGAIVALDTVGKLALDMMPTGIGPDAETMVTSDTLTAGQLVNIYDNGGTKTARKASATDTTKPAMGFVLAGTTTPDSAVVFYGGLNNLYPKGTLVAADTGKPVFLSATAGAVTITPPVAAGNYMQQIGRVVEVGSTNASLTCTFGPGIVM